MLLERSIPEMQMQNLALARQEVVFDAEAQHRLKMAAENGCRDKLGHFGGFVAAFFNRVQRGIAQLLARSVLFFAALLIPLRRASVEVPAEVVDRRSMTFGAMSAHFAFGYDGADFGERSAFKMLKANDDIGYLNAGVVDVVLHVDFLPRSAQQANECIPEDSVAQVADVSGLVGIDGSMFDQRADSS